MELGAYVCARNLEIGWLENKHMKGVVVGKTTAIFPKADGSFSREVGDSVGGRGVVVMMLTSKCNHMSVLYFADLSGLHRYAHTSKAHRAGWEWWAQSGSDVDMVSIGHEVYDVPEGKWETIYGNSKPFGFGIYFPGMGATIVLGSQWGDEGKGKLVDILTESADLVARAQELAELEAQGLEKPRERIFISDRAHLSLNVHALVDGLEEVELGGNSIGTTKRGIGPTYSTKAARSGIRVGDIFHKELFDRKIREIARAYKLRYGDLLTYDVDRDIAKFDKYREELAPFVVDAVPLIASAEASNSRILIEGANALMLDLDFGSYPYVTSSNTGLGGIFTGLALNPRKVTSIIGVVKAYTTRVGGGPFPSEDETEECGVKLQEVGREWGVTTGRRRRLDLVVLKYSCQINHYTELNITKLDVLDGFSKIKIAVGYKDEQGTDMGWPADLSRLDNCQVTYHEMDGWNTPTTEARKYSDLPKQAQEYVEYIEKFTGVPVNYIGVGASRDAVVVKGL
ncbi:putative Adenylosuccinate synthetase [Glarea lozoyensis 74030]|uniref:Adenylosuccinate synthetase n=1 Tax=Glarea lozoyensis (strain ATCC 74030 / MF5533) TaxID=1104152 RepID=H0ENT4_GLAL7|nr:putative Adenylosuccinate synthetase [Glarea lozoyensis 74030]